MRRLRCFFDRYTLSGGTACVTFLGTEGADVLDTSFDGAGITAYPYGGDDVASGTWHDDLFFAGAGSDTVDALDGQDVCVDTELATGCEASAIPDDLEGGGTTSRADRVQIRGAQLPRYVRSSATRARIAADPRGSG